MARKTKKDLIEEIIFWKEAYKNVRNGIKPDAISIITKANFIIAKEDTLMFGRK